MTWKREGSPELGRCPLCMPVSRVPFGVFGLQRTPYICLTPSSHPQTPLPVLPLVQSHQSCCAPQVSRLRDPLEEERGCDLSALFLFRWLAIKSAKLWGPLSVCHSRTGQDWWVWVQEHQGPSSKRPQHFMLGEYKNRERESLGSPLLTPWCRRAHTQTGNLAVNPDSEFVSLSEGETPRLSTLQCFAP